MIDVLENILNWQADQDWAWWPVVSWRPAKKNFYTHSLVFKQMLLVGPFLTLCLLLLVYLSPRLNLVVLWVFGLSWIWVGSTLLFYIFRFAWNRRATRLQSRKK